MECLSSEIRPRFLIYFTAKDIPFLNRYLTYGILKSKGAGLNSMK